MVSIRGFEAGIVLVADEVVTVLLARAVFADAATGLLADAAREPSVVERDEVVEAEAEVARVDEEAAEAVVERLEDAEADDDAALAVDRIEVVREELAEVLPLALVVAAVVLVEVEATGVPLTAALRVLGKGLVAAPLLPAALMVATPPGMLLGV